MTCIVAVRLPAVAVMVAVPVLTPIRTPVDEIDATDASELPHVTV